LISTWLAGCGSRDPKGLYSKAREDKVAEFTGIASPYEPPEWTCSLLALVIDTAQLALDHAVSRLIFLLPTPRYGQ